MTQAGVIGTTESSDVVAELFYGAVCFIPEKHCFWFLGKVCLLAPILIYSSELIRGVQSQWVFTSMM